nr:MAG TPA: hypothetical protein [Caudoviricetes sp.]
MGVIRLQTHVFIERLGVLLRQQVNGLLQRRQKIVIPLTARDQPCHHG